MNARFFPAVIFAASLSAWNVDAQTQSGDHASHHAPGATSATRDDALVQGEVSGVSREANELTLRHGPIPNLDIPGTTTAFRVRETRMLEGLMPGDKLRFRAERVDGVYTVTAVERDR